MIMEYDIILYDIQSIVGELEFDGLIYFPDDDARAEFIDDCVADVIDKFDMYEHYMPDYVAEILDLAKLYGYGEGV